jgi:hypothetical protein
MKLPKIALRGKKMPKEPSFKQFAELMTILAHQ